MTRRLNLRTILGDARLRAALIAMAVEFICAIERTDA